MSDIINQVKANVQKTVTEEVSNIAKKPEVKNFISKYKVIIIIAVIAVICLILFLFFSQAAGAIGMALGGIFGFNKHNVEKAEKKHDQQIVTLNGKINAVDKAIADLQTQNTNNKQEYLNKLTEIKEKYNKQSDHPLTDDEVLEYVNSLKVN